ncbi:MAG: sugar kinase [Verrucomicrobia bacterium]|nr:MAG: sugar kinase [Verrucomicrobiota bacterium]
MKTIVAFGEIMGRISMPGFLRFSQAMPGHVDVEFAGAEANVATSIALLGGPTAFVTALPANEIADACVASLRRHGIDTRHILRTQHGRLGLYFLEKGANQRAGNVVYDREGSAIATTPATAYDWDTILGDAGWLHLTGITPAVSAVAAEANLAAARAARRLGLPVSCDLNFRGKLWRWNPGLAPRELAAVEMSRLLPEATHLVAGREDAAEMLGIRPRVATRTDDGPDPDAILDVARQLHARFPRLETIAITLRESRSASHHRWGGFLYETAADRFHLAPSAPDGGLAPYEITHIVDRVGGGDAFSAGLIFALNTPELKDPNTALRFATAASCLAHSIEGDANLSSRAEIEALMGGSASGRVKR